MPAHRNRWLLALAPTGLAITIAVARVLAITPTPTVPSAQGTFANDGAEPASALHVTAGPYPGAARVIENAPGCPEPAVNLWWEGDPPYNIVAQWSLACVDPGERATILVFADCPGCGIGQPQLVAWRFGPPALGTGDVDCDGETTSVDAALVLQHEASLLGGFACRLAADVDGDGNINAVDASLILQHEAGLVTGLPV